MRALRSLLAVGLALVSASVLAQAAAPGPQRAVRLAGVVKAEGSSTVAGLLKPLADAFAVQQPEVQLDIGGSGSGTALAGMLAAPGTLGLLSRPLNAAERERLRAQYGQAPAELKIAVDAVGIYVFKDNPVPALTLEQLRRVFGQGSDGATQWGDLGAQGRWATEPLTRYGLERGRGAQELFRELVLQGGDFDADVHVEPVSTSVVQGVATQAGGIGYASVFFRTQRTRLLPLLHQGQAVEPTAANALAGRYPLARFLYVVVSRPPGGTLPAPQRAFLQFVLSRDGQEIVARQGFYALDATLLNEGRALIDGSSAAPRPAE